MKRILYLSVSNYFSDYNAAFVAERLNYFAVNSPESVYLDYPVIYTSGKLIARYLTLSAAPAGCKIIRKVAKGALIEKLYTGIVDEKKVTYYLYNIRLYKTLLDGKEVTKDLIEDFKTAAASFSSDKVYVPQDDECYEKPEEKQAMKIEGHLVQSKLFGVQFEMISESDADKCNEILKIIALKSKLRKAMVEARMSTNVDEEAFLESYLRYYVDKFSDRPGENFIMKTLVAHAGNYRLEASTPEGEARQTNPTNDEEIEKFGIRCSQNYAVIKFYKKTFSAYEKGAEKRYKDILRWRISKENKKWWSVLYAIVRRSGFKLDAIKKLYVDCMQNNIYPEHPHEDGGFRPDLYYIGEDGEFYINEFRRDARHMLSKLKEKEAVKA